MIPSRRIGLIRLDPPPPPPSLKQKINRGRPTRTALRKGIRFREIHRGRQTAELPYLSEHSVWMTPPQGRRSHATSLLRTTIWAWATTTSFQWATTHPLSRPPTEALRAAPDYPPRGRGDPRTRTGGHGRLGGCRRPHARWTAARVPASEPTYNRLPHHRWTAGQGAREPIARRRT